jgi:hypothetical protein
MFLFLQFCKKIVDNFLLLLLSVCKKDGQKQTGRSGRFQEKGFKLYSTNSERKTKSRTLYRLSKAGEEENNIK